MSYFAIFLASLIGSPHCAGMCGGFVAFYSADTEKKFWPHVLYNGGRLITYVLLGVLAGFIGKSIDIAGNMAGIQEVTAIIVGCLMIFWGLRMLISGSAGSLTFQGQGKISQWFQKLHKQVLKKELQVSAETRALTIGLLSTFLPCGWLYLFAAAAAATGSPVEGALVMAFFWLGTVPVMATLGGVLTVLSSKARVYVPRATGALLVCAGIFALLFKMNVIPHEHHAHHHHPKAVLEKPHEHSAHEHSLDEHHSQKSNVQEHLQ